MKNDKKIDDLIKQTIGKEGFASIVKQSTSNASKIAQAMCKDEGVVMDENDLVGFELFLGKSISHLVFTDVVKSKGPDLFPNIADTGMAAMFVNLFSPLGKMLILMEESGILNDSDFCDSAGIDVDDSPIDLLTIIFTRIATEYIEVYDMGEEMKKFKSNEKGNEVVH